MLGYRTVLLALQSNNITNQMCVCVFLCVLVRVYSDGWVSSEINGCLLFVPFIGKLPADFRMGIACSLPAYTFTHTNTRTHSHNELLLGGPRLWHICCGGDIRHSCRGSQDSPCITQRKKGGTVVEGSNDNFTSKSLLHKTMAAYKDTLRHILSNWPADL